MQASRFRLAVLALGLMTGCGRTPPTFIERPPIKGHTREVTSIAFAPGGLVLASRGADSLKIWDVSKGLEIRSFASDGSDFGTLAVAPDGQRLATEQIGQGAIAWDLASASEPIRYAFPPARKAELKDATTRGWGLAYSPDGKLLAGGGSREGDSGFLTIWETANQQASELPPIKRPITSLAFSPDGKTIGTGSMDGKIVLWDVETRKERRTIDANRSYLAPVVFSPDGRTFASANEFRWVRLWDVATGKEVGTFKGHIKAILSIAFHPNGQTLVSGDSGGTYFVWDVPTRKMLTRLEPKDHGKVWSLAFSIDGRLLASGCEDKKIHLWDVSGDIPLR